MKAVRRPFPSKVYQQQDDRWEPESNKDVDNESTHVRHYAVQKTPNGHSQTDAGRGDNETPQRFCRLEMVSADVIPVAKGFASLAGPMGHDSHPHSGGDSCNQDEDDHDEGDNQESQIAREIIIMMTAIVILAPKRRNISRVDEVGGVKNRGEADDDAHKDSILGRLLLGVDLTGADGEMGNRHDEGKVAEDLYECCDAAKVAHCHLALIPVAGSPHI